MSDGVPGYVDPETTADARARTAERIARLETELAALKEHAPSTEWVREMVTNARKSIESEIVGLPSKDRIEAIVTDVDTLATKESLAALATRVEAIQPPKFWQLVLILGGLLATVGGFVWSAHDQVTRLEIQNVELKSKVDALEKILNQQTTLVSGILGRP